jgi:hypothetical protein
MADTLAVLFLDVILKLLTPNQESALNMEVVFDVLLLAVITVLKVGMKRVLYMVEVGNVYLKIAQELQRESRINVAFMEKWL